MKILIAILISLTILLPSSAIGTGLYQWKDVDQQMIDIIKAGFEIVSHSHSFDTNRIE